MHRSIRTLSALAVFTIATFSQSQTVFYGGDVDRVDGIPASNSPGGSTTLVADDFTLDATTHLSSVFGNFLSDTTLNGLYYEIRQGVSVGNGGTLLFSGELSASVGDLGFSVFGFEAYKVSGSVGNVTLGPGDYFLGLAALSAAPGNAFLATTSGANAIGTPIADGGSFTYDRGAGDSNFDTVEDLYGADYDFSLGVAAQAVPEPTSIVALGLGALAFLRRRRSLA